MIFADTSFFVALADSKDDWYKDAVRIKESDTVKQTLVVSNFIISEALTSIGKRKGGKVADNLFKYFIDNCKIIYVAEEEFTSAEQVFLDYDGVLSMPDATSVILMKKNGIKEIISFDSDFDKVSGISRVY